ncbi:MAG: hypothetical protein KDG57_22890 [Rhodoferax sp.]|nr:hypothetical protein [Rhodoferax sp.]
MRMDMLFKAVLAAATLGAASAAQAADGLQVSSLEAWPVLQTRVNLMVARGDAGRGVELRHAALLTDYYLERHGSEAQSRWRGGFRATSGIVLGGIGPSAAYAGGWSPSLTTVPQDGLAPEQDAWPYIGLGYSGVAPQGGWGFSADLGLALRQGAAAAELGRAVFGLRGWEGTLRRLDAMPMLQLGVHYRF